MLIISPSEPVLAKSKEKPLRRLARGFRDEITRTHGGGVCGATCLGARGLDGDAGVMC